MKAHIRNKESVQGHEAEVVCLLLKGSTQVVLLRYALNHAALQPLLPVLPLQKSAGKHSGPLYFILPLQHYHLIYLQTHVLHGSNVNQF